MEISVQPVQISEADTLSAISKKCFYDTFHKQNSEKNMTIFLEENFTADKLAAEILLDGNFFYFAKIKDEIVGYIKLSSLENPPQLGKIEGLEIARIYVVSDKIGLGVGKSMMEFALSLAKQLDKRVVWLGVWEQNHHAIRFYQGYGFEKIGEHVFMVGNDAQTDWLMSKKLCQES